MVLLLGSKRFKSYKYHIFIISYTQECVWVDDPGHRNQNIQCTVYNTMDTIGLSSLSKYPLLVYCGSAWLINIGQTLFGP